MIHKNPNRYADRIVFVVALVAAFVLYGEAMYRYGKTQGQALKCATVEGEQVVSTVGKVCHYAKSYGRAIKTRRAG